ncbi:unnamed protein product [Enterobius vermicularis]|uniref:Ion channel n=1 Tax=Enterobius vermicularis TaxID=51028 RepID=A0A0N4UUG3_ENTVE|nr:unnamed protein product [Enterobius vermicularis]
MIKKSLSGGIFDTRLQTKPQEAAPPPPPPEKTGGRTIWRNIIWQLILFVYSGIGGVAFSAIEGEHDEAVLLNKYHDEVKRFEARKIYQIDFHSTLEDGNLDDFRTKLIRNAIANYEKQIGVFIKEPVREHTHWDIWGGVYYSASLYTTIGYGNFHPETNAGRIVSMVYAFCGIPLVFTIMFEWGFLYFSWLEMFWKWFNQKVFKSSQEALIRRRLEQERTRRAGCQMSLRTTSTPKFIESGKRIAQLEIELSEAEKQRTVPLKVALVFFFTWILISAAVVRLWETNWSYFTAYYYFFTSLTTIGLGDVVTEYPQYVIFNMILTMIGLSVVGLCLAIVQSKIRLIFDRMSRSIDSQYRIRQIDPDVATMTIIPNEKEGIKRCRISQPLQDRLIFIAMDEHKKALLEERWKQKSSLINKVTQTWPKIADKCIQTGQRDYDDDDDSDDESYSDESGAEYDDCGRRIVPPSNLRYIYTVFD